MNIRNRVSGYVLKWKNVSGSATLEKVCTLMKEIKQIHTIEKEEKDGYYYIKVICKVRLRGQIIKSIVQKNDLNILVRTVKPYEMRPGVFLY